MKYIFTFFKKNLQVNTIEPSAYDSVPFCMSLNLIEIEGIVM